MTPTATFVTVRGRIFWLMVFAALAAALVLGVVSFAQASKGVVSSIGEPGSGAGQFREPVGLAVDQSSSRLYVADGGDLESGTNNRIQVFGTDGGYISSIGGFGSGAGEFAVPRGVAVDPADGALYVTEQFNFRVQKLDSSGDFLYMVGNEVNQSTGGDICTAASGDTCQAGTPGSGPGEFEGPVSGQVAVDPVSGDFYVAEQEKRQVYRFDADGTYLSSFGEPGEGEGQIAGQPYNLAVNSSGTVYVVDNIRKVLEFDAANAYVGEFAAADLEGRRPGAVAVDPADDHVYVLRDDEAGTGSEVAEFSAAGTLLDVHGTGDLPDLSDFFLGLAVDSNNGRIYVSDVTRSRVYVLDEGLPPTVAMGAVSDVSDDGASFAGEVDPEGVSTEATFQYRRTGDSEWLDSGFSPVGAGTAAVPVAATVSGLDPNTAYEVRLLANGFGPPVASPPVDFNTATAPPLVFSAVEPGTDGAQLRGEIHAQNMPTTYRFEWGTVDCATGPCASVPVVPGDAGAAVDPVQVSEQISDLEPGVTYHFRLVAVNDAGTAATPDRIFKPLDDGPAPQRGYERVSPNDKGGFGVKVQSGTQAAADGSSVVYPAFISFAGNPSSPITNHYLGKRTATGWGTSGINPPVTDLSVPLVAVSDDMSRMVIRSDAELTPGAPPTNPTIEDGAPAYLRDLSTGTYRLLTPQRLDGEGPYRNDVIGGDADFSHVLIETDAQLTPDAPASSEAKLYLWSEGALELASVMPDGTPVAGSAGGPSIYTLERNDNPISDDGSRFFFSTPPLSETENALPGELFVREGDETALIHPNARFRGATPSGDYAFFTIGQEGSLRRYDVATGESVEIASRSKGVAGFSEDGGRIYFQCSAGEVPGQPSAPGDYMCMWDRGVKKLVAGPFPENLDPWEGAPGFSGQPPWGGLKKSRDASALSADGETLAFLSSEPLTGYDATDSANRCGGKPRCFQLFVYRASESTPAGPDLSCLTCQGPGQPPAGVNMLSFPSENAELRTDSDRREVSADGSRVFFSSSERLLPADVNGKSDVYLWEPGRLSIVSSGRSDSPSYLLDASRNGDDVFFTTRESLVGGDVDGSMVDLYDARVGGGFSEFELPVAACAGDSCQGLIAPPPLVPIPGSAGSVGQGGNARAAACRRLGARAQRLAARAAKAPPRRAGKLKRKARKLAREARNCQNGGRR